MIQKIVINQCEKKNVPFEIKQLVFQALNHELPTLITHKMCSYFSNSVQMLIKMLFTIMTPAPSHYGEKKMEPQRRLWTSSLTEGLKQPLRKASIHHQRTVIEDNSTVILHFQIIPPHCLQNNFSSAKNKGRRYPIPVLFIQMWFIAAI